ncbi:MAG TPA: hypothetical protein VJ824_15260 [Bacillota bacterium]|nr:hypothetical protein [Bacillota bacterium]
MGEEIRRMLHECMGEAIEIKTKQDEKICGKLSWLSPDRCMAEITLKNGQIQTVTDFGIKTIKKLVK